MLRHRAYRTVEQRRLVLTEAMSQLYQADVCDVDLITRGTMDKMGKELDQLIARSKYFGKADIKAVDTSYLEQFNFLRRISGRQSMGAVMAQAAYVDSMQLKVSSAKLHRRLIF
jgi:hypothetical protein